VENVVAGLCLEYATQRGYTGGCVVMLQELLFFSPRPSTERRSTDDRHCGIRASLCSRKRLSR
jgi:hypothetical protein